LPAYLLLHVYGSVLTAMDQLKTFIWLLAGAVVLNTVLNIFLIPGLGAVGCCLAALVSQYSCAVAVFAVGSQKNRIPFDAKGGRLLLAVSFLLACLFYVGWKQALPPLLLFLIGGSAAMLVLFNYLSILKRPFISR
jgi:Na+-driven multidrug efflux pump